MIALIIIIIISIIANIYLLLTITNKKNNQEIQTETTEKDSSSKEENLEIERKWLIDKNNLSFDLNQAIKMDIEQAMQKLDINTKTILIMKLYLEYTFDDIAKNLEKPLSTVKSSYYTGLENLKQLLGIEEVNE